MNFDVNPGKTQSKSETAAATLLFVDDESNILSSLKRLFRPLGYRIITAQSGAEGLTTLEAQQVDLIISDMRMPGMDGATFLAQAAQQWPATVRILLTGYSDLTSTIAAVNKGRIYRYISKPWEENDIVLTVKRALEQKHLEEERRRLEILTKKQNEELRELNATLESKVAARTGELQQTVSFLELAHKSLDQSYRTTVEVFSNLIEMRESRGQGRARVIAQQVAQLAELLGLDTAESQNLHYAALLRNIGKINLSDHLLAKPFSTMNETERKTFIQHPIVGEGLLMALEPLQEAASLIHYQHEHYDGTGYPDGIKGDAIPVGARILKVVGDYNDLQHGLLLTAHLDQSEARDYLVKHRGTRYDPQMVDMFRKVIGRLAEHKDKVSERCVKSNGLQIGMVLSRDLVLNDKVLLLSQGHSITEHIIERIHHLEESINDDLEIYVLTEGVD